MGFTDNTVQIYESASGKVTLTLEGHAGAVRSVAFSPDGTRLATGSYDNTVKIWDLIRGKAAMTLKGYTNRVLSVAFSSDGKLLATKSTNNLVKIWALAPKMVSVGVVGYKDTTDVTMLPLANLTLPQLTTYGLETLLDQLPSNEEKLIATGQVWQIAAFADLYADKIAKSLPRRADYERAQRLYAACLRSGVEEAYFREKVRRLEEVWKERGE